MQPRDFCYWLQGYFEIGGETIAVSPSQQTIIRNHLNLVFSFALGEKRAAGAEAVGLPAEFCHWLKGYFDIAGDDASITLSRLTAIKAKLNEVFVHAIDQQYPAARRQHLQATHDGREKRGAAEIEAMC